MYYLVYYVNTLLPNKKKLTLFPFHAIHSWRLDRVSDVSASDWRSQTQVKL